MKCVIINPPPVSGFFLNREPDCAGLSSEPRNPLLLYSLAETLKKYTEIEDVVPLDLSIQDVNINSFKNSDYIIILNSNSDYSLNKEWNEKFLSGFSGKKIVIITPNVNPSCYIYNNAITIGGIFPEQEILKLFSDKKISYNEIPISIYDRSNYKKVWIESGRGCPYNCTFCSQANTDLMLKLPEILFEEIKLVHKQGVYFAYFAENEFTINKKRVVKLCELLKNSGIYFKWGCQTRVDLVDDNLLKLMSEAGCIQISYGIESVNPQTQKMIGKNLDLEKTKHMVKITKKYMLVSLYFIVGLPKETEKTIMKQLDFIKEIKPDYVNLFPIITESGMELYNECLANGWLKNENNNICKRYNIGFNEECVISYPNLSSEKIIELTLLLRDHVKDMLKADIIRFFRRVKWKFVLKNKVGIMKIIGKTSGKVS